ncbi:hypothetical protein LNQ52_27905 [Klebsiella pneumoniae subsp. pneumoniae]|nr:hypothetical protein [Klebsiella pneumoniae subsp. pneumoniae]
MNIDLTREAVGTGQEWRAGLSERYLAERGGDCPRGGTGLHRDVPQRVRRSVFRHYEEWKAIKVEASDTYDWQEDSTYIRLSPFFDEMGAEPLPVEDIRGADPRHAGRLSHHGPHFAGGEHQSR